MSRASFPRVLKELRARPVGSVPWKCAQQLTNVHPDLAGVATKLERFGERDIPHLKRVRHKRRPVGRIVGEL